MLSNRKTIRLAVEQEGKGQGRGDGESRAYHVDALTQRSRKPSRGEGTLLSFS